MTRTIMYAKKISIHIEQFPCKSIKGFTVSGFGKALTVAVRWKWVRWEKLVFKIEDEVFGKGYFFGCFMVYVSVDRNGATT